MRRCERTACQCAYCGKTVMVIPSRVGRFRYCSRQCRGHVMVKHMNARRRPPAEYARPPVRRGAANNKYVDAITLTCRNCGTTFERKPWQLNRKHGNTGDYCSAHCRDEYRAAHQSGANSPFWVGGPQSYRGRNWGTVRLVVVNAQQGQCAACGKVVGKSLPVHHITPARAFDRREDANALSNLIGLCNSCHLRREAEVNKVAGTVAISPIPYSRVCRKCGQMFLTESMCTRNCEACWHAVCKHCARTFRKGAPSDPDGYCSHRCALLARNAVTRRT